ncbi:pentapeptide repeat-containing protein [Kitasatospora sp. NPDC127059]|uniref:pentapeptide repeat-containing protein n=1 Tax=unclassified Kitasatospora TaxID=2633591 RepID=UPI00364A7CA3
MPGISPWQWILVGILVLAGFFLAVLAWRLAAHPALTGEKQAESSVLSGVGGGLIAGFAVGLSVMFLQQAIGKSEEVAAWRADVAIASVIPGFDSHAHSIKGLNFSGKVLRDADFKHQDLSGFEFRDADLRGADFTGANLRNANLIGARVTAAELRGANLEGALLQDADFSWSDTTVIASLSGAEANERTCWPPGFLNDRLMQGVAAQQWRNMADNSVHPPSKGREGPCSPLEVGNPTDVGKSASGISPVPVHHGSGGPAVVKEAGSEARNCPPGRARRSGYGVR